MSAGPFVQIWPSSAAESTNLSRYHFLSRDSNCNLMEKSRKIHQASIITATASFAINDVWLCLCDETALNDQLISLLQIFLFFFCRRRRLRHRYAAIRDSFPSSATEKSPPVRAPDEFSWKIWIPFWFPGLASARPFFVPIVIPVGGMQRNIDWLCIRARKEILRDALSRLFFSYLEYLMIWNNCFPRHQRTAIPETLFFCVP